MNAHAVRTLLRRKNLVPTIVVLLFSFVTFFAVASSIAQSPAKEEREIEDRIPQHLPIKVKVNNPEKVKDLKNDDWLGDLEIEVKNTGDKPIYYLYISVILPDTKHDETGHTIGYQLWYGRPALVDLTTPILPDDVPIQPGESCTLKVSQNSVEGWKVYKAKKNIVSPKKLEIRFELINFGDGTGFDGPDGAPLPFRKQGENVSCREGPATNADTMTGNARIGIPTASSAGLTSFSLPVNFLSASFFPLKNSYASPNPKAALDICCPSGVPSDC